DCCNSSPAEHTRRHLDRRHSPSEWLGHLKGAMPRRGAVPTVGISARSHAAPRYAIAARIGTAAALWSTRIGLLQEGPRRYGSLRLDSAAQPSKPRAPCWWLQQLGL